MNREWLARAPLPLLALSAAWGVWQFQMQFTPWFVALLSALAFESVYLSLAFVPVPDSRRATVISITAVVVSVVYNTLSSLFHLRPALLESRTLVMDGVLAILHGAPLAIVAYAVADLLLHRRQDAPVATTLVASLQAELAQARHESTAWREECATQEQLIDAMLAEHDGVCAKPAPLLTEETITVAQRTLSVRQLAKLTGKPETTLRRQLAQLEA